MELSYLYLMSFLPMAALAWAAIFPSYVRFPSGPRWIWGVYGAAVLGIIGVAAPGLLGVLPPGKPMALLLVSAMFLSLFGAVVALTARAPVWTRLTAGVSWILLAMSLAAFLAGALGMA